MNHANSASKAPSRDVDAKNAESHAGADSAQGGASYALSPMTFPFTFRIGIPPRSLGKGSSIGWWQVRKDFADVKAETFGAVHERLQERRQEIRQFDALVMDICWRASNRSHNPDPDNAIIRTAAVRDCLENIGIVVDDKHIQIGRVTYEPTRKGMECVVIELRAARSEMGDA